MAERQTSRSGAGGPPGIAARPLAYRMAPRLVRGALPVPANDNPAPPKVRIKQALFRILLLSMAAGGLYGLVGH